MLCVKGTPNYCSLCCLDAHSSLIVTNFM